MRDVRVHIIIELRAIKNYIHALYHVVYLGPNINQ